MPVKATPTLEPSPVLESLKLKPTVSRLLTSQAAQVAGAALLIFAVMWAVEFSGPAILDNDGYYHIRWSKLLRESAPRLPEFTWLPLTALNAQDYADHHLLYHLLLIPFTYGDERIGAKLAAVVFSTAGLTALFALLVVYRVRYRWLWLAPLVAGSEPFLYRMAMTRAPGVALMLLGAAAFSVLKRRFVWTGLLSFTFVWLYSLFPLILVFALAHAVAVYISERRMELRVALSAAVGLMVGLVINPYFPKNVVLFTKHLRMKLTADYPVNVGIEWYPYETWTILVGSGVAFAIYLAGLIAFDLRRRISDPKPLFFLLVSTVFLIMTFKSRRFVEYWPPFAALFAAFAISGRRIGRRRMTRTVDQAILAVRAAAAAMILVSCMALNAWRASSEVRAETDPFAYRGGAEWLAKNTPAGSLVFNTDWDDFPLLFYYNTHNRYVAGLDPTYLYERDRELWGLYERVTLGREKEPAPIILGRFGAEYVFSDNHHDAFLRVAADSGDFEIAYQDQYATVLKVLRGQ